MQPHDVINPAEFSIRPSVADPRGRHACVASGRDLPRVGWSLFRQRESGIGRVCSTWASERPELLPLVRMVEQLNALGEPPAGAHSYPIVHARALKSGVCTHCLSSGGGPEDLVDVERRGDWEVGVGSGSTTSALCADHARAAAPSAPLNAVLDAHYGRQRRLRERPAAPTPPPETPEARYERAVRGVASIIRGSEPPELAEYRARNLVASLALIFELRRSIPTPAHVGTPEFTEFSELQ